MALLLTGPPGIGKTTAVRAVAHLLGHSRLGGFFTEEIRARGVRQGFRLITFHGKQAVMAHVNHRGGPRVGKYVVDLAVLETMSRDALAVREDADVYLVDEIGKMECFSETFVEAVRALLAAGPPVVATVGQRGEGFIAEVKRRPDVELWELTRDNRDAIPARVVAWLKQRTGILHDR
jgi:nucleoside-triphosphatase